MFRIRYGECTKLKVYEIITYEIFSTRKITKLRYIVHIKGHYRSEEWEVALASLLFWLTEYVCTHMKRALSYGRLIPPPPPPPSTVTATSALTPLSPILYRYTPSCSTEIANHTLAPYPSGVVMVTDPLQLSLTTNLTADPPVFTLTCVSTGGPATTITWTRDGAAATGVTSQIVLNMTSITYNNTLTVTGREPGNYTCSVANVRTAPPAAASLSVAGEWDYTIPIFIVCNMCLWCEGGS